MATLKAATPAKTGAAPKAGAESNTLRPTTLIDFAGALAILGSKQIVEHEGKFRAAVTNSGNFIEAKPETNQPAKWLFGTNLITQKQYDNAVAALRALVGDKKAQAKTDFNELLRGAGLSISVTMPRNGIRPQNMPNKGARVFVYVDYVQGSEGGAGKRASEADLVLRITGYEAMAADSTRSGKIGITDLAAEAKGGVLAD